MIQVSPFPKKPDKIPTRRPSQIRLIPFLGGGGMTRPIRFMFGDYEDALHTRKSNTLQPPKSDFRVTWDSSSDIPERLPQVSVSKPITGIKLIHLHQFGTFVITAFSPDGDMFFFCMVVNRSGQKNAPPIMVQPPSGKHFETAFVFDNDTDPFPWSIRLSPEIPVPYTCQVIPLIFSTV